MSVRHIYLAAAFLTGFLLVGWSHWALPYALVQLPESLSAVALAAIAMLSFALVVTRTASARRTGIMMVLAPAAAVMARVMVETGQDPTSHNLWPFEIVLTIGAASIFVFPALLTAAIMRRWIV